jgi:hypothetical protein
MRNTTISFYRIKKINLFFSFFSFLFFIFFSSFFLLFWFIKILFVHRVSSGVLQSSLFVDNIRVGVINSPSVWHHQTCSSILQPCRDTRHSPCDYTPHTRFHNFFCYLSPCKLRYGRPLLYLFYTIKKFNLFFFLFTYFMFLFFLIN